MKENRCTRALRLEVAVMAEMWLIEVDPDGRMPSRRSAILFLKRWELRSWRWGKGCVHFGHSERSPMSCKAHSTRGVIGGLNRHLGPGK